MSTSSTSTYRAVGRAAKGRLLLLVCRASHWAVRDRWNDPPTNIAAGAAFGSVTGTQPALMMQLNATFNF